MTTDHTCLGEWAANPGLLEGSPVDRSWCLSHQMDTVMGLEPINAVAPELQLWRQGALSVFYAPWDWVNTSARVMLVGITPGLHQATEALGEAQRSLAEGLSPEDALRRADAVGSFSGPMRTNLVTMLDGIGLADGACSVFPILPGPTGIGSVCTPSGVPVWLAPSWRGAAGR